MAFIYVLIDPRDNEVRYVGKTGTTLERRLHAHIDKAQRDKSTCHRVQWLKKLLTQGYHPRIELVQELPDKNINDAERYWILEFRRRGCDLTNTAAGGDGGAVSRWWEDLEKLDVAVEKAKATRLANGGYQSWIKGKKQSPEYIAKRVASVDYTQVSEAVRKTYAERKQVAEEQGLLNPYSRPAPNRGIPMEEESRQKVSASVKQYWESLTDEEREDRTGQINAASKAWLEKVACGESIDPRKGRPSPMLGVARGPEPTLKMWETRRANGFVSQREYIEKLAELCGLSIAIVERSVKGYGSKVRAEKRELVWKTYYENRDMLSGLNIIIDEKVQAYLDLF